MVIILIIIIISIITVIVIIITIARKIQTSTSFTLRLTFTDPLKDRTLSSGNSRFGFSKELLTLGGDGLIRRQIYVRNFASVRNSSETMNSRW